MIIWRLNVLGVAESKTDHPSLFIYCPQVFDTSKHLYPHMWGAFLRANIRSAAGRPLTCWTQLWFIAVEGCSSCLVTRSQVELFIPLIQAETSPPRLDGLTSDLMVPRGWIIMTLVDLWQSGLGLGSVPSGGIFLNPFTFHQAFNWPNSSFDF